MFTRLRDAWDTAHIRLEQTRAYRTLDAVARLIRRRAPLADRAFQAYQLDVYDVPQGLVDLWCDVYHRGRLEDRHVLRMRLYGIQVADRTANHTPAQTPTQHDSTSPGGHL